MENPTDRATTIDEIIAKSNVTSWTDADFERAAKIGRGFFDDFAEQVRKWRDLDEIFQAERSARLRLYFDHRFCHQTEKCKTEK